MNETVSKNYHFGHKDITVTGQCKLINSDCNRRRVNSQTWKNTSNRLFNKRSGDIFVYVYLIVERRKSFVIT